MPFIKNYEILSVSYLHNTIHGKSHNACVAYHSHSCTEYVSRRSEHNIKCERCVAIYLDYSGISTLD